MATIGRDFASASRIISEHSNETFEVTKDGGIRRQNALEKFLLFASRFIGAHQKTVESKDAKVAEALQSLYEKSNHSGSTTLAPNVNPLFSRFFEAPKKLSERGLAKLSQDQAKESKKASASLEAANALRTKQNETAHHFTVVSDLRIPQNPQSIEDFDPPNGGESDRELDNLAFKVGAEKFVKRAIDKHKQNPQDVTPAEFKWLPSEVRQDNLEERLNAYSPEEISRAKVAYNDALKLALRDWVAAEKAKGNHEAGGVRDELVRTLEGNRGRQGCPFDLEEISDPKEIIDPVKTNQFLSDAGFKLGEGPLAKLKNADYDYVQWARNNPVTLPPGEESPIRF
mgnify:CR=1 FL=1